MSVAISIPVVPEHRGKDVTCHNCGSGEFMFIGHSVGGNFLLPGHPKSTFTGSFYLRCTGCQTIVVEQSPVMDRFDFESVCNDLTMAHQLADCLLDMYETEINMEAHSKVYDILKPYTSTTYSENVESTDGISTWVDTSAVSNVPGVHPETEVGDWVYVEGDTGKVTSNPGEGDIPVGVALGEPDSNGLVNIKMFESYTASIEAPRPPKKKKKKRKRKKKQPQKDLALLIEF